MKKETEYQIDLLKKYGIKNYTIDADEKIVINNGFFDLSSSTSFEKEFLKNTTINANIGFSSLTSFDKDFLKYTTLNGYLFINNLTSSHKTFLGNITINGALYLKNSHYFHALFNSKKTIKKLSKKQILYSGFINKSLGEKILRKEIIII